MARKSLPPSPDTQREARRLQDRIAEKQATKHVRRGPGGQFKVPHERHQQPPAEEDTGAAPDDLT